MQTGNIKQSYTRYTTNKYYCVTQSIFLLIQHPFPHPIQVRNSKSLGVCRLKWCEDSQLWKVDEEPFSKVIEALQKESTTIEESYCHCAATRTTFPTLRKPPSNPRIDNGTNRRLFPAHQRNERELRRLTHRWHHEYTELPNVILFHILHAQGL